MRKVNNSVWYACLLLSVICVIPAHLDVQFLFHYRQILINSDTLSLIPPYNYAPDQGMIIVPRVPEEECYPAVAIGKPTFGNPKDLLFTIHALPF